MHLGAPQQLPPGWADALAAEENEQCSFNSSRHLEGEMPALQKEMNNALSMALLQENMNGYIDF